MPGNTHNQGVRWAYPGLRTAAASAAAVLLLAPAVGCASEDPAGWPVGHGYTLTGVTDSGHDQALSSSAPVTMHVVSSEQVLVDDGCNVSTIESKVDGSHVDLTLESRTQQGCLGGDLVYLATLTVDFFQGEVAWQRDGGRLILTKASRVLVFTDRN